MKGDGAQLGQTGGEKNRSPVPVGEELSLQCSSEPKEVMCVLQIH